MWWELEPFKSWAESNGTFAFIVVIAGGVVAIAVTLLLLVWLGRAAFARRSASTPAPANPAEAKTEDATTKEKEPEVTEEWEFPGQWRLVRRAKLWTLEYAENPAFFMPCAVTRSGLRKAKLALWKQITAANMEVATTKLVEETQE